MNWLVHPLSWNAFNRHGHLRIDCLVNLRKVIHMGWQFQEFLFWCHQIYYWSPGHAIFVGLLSLLTTTCGRESGGRIRGRAIRIKVLPKRAWLESSNVKLCLLASPFCVWGVIEARVSRYPVKHVKATQSDCALRGDSFVEHIAPKIRVANILFVGDLRPLGRTHIKRPSKSVWLKKVV